MTPSDERPPVQAQDQFAVDCAATIVDALLEANPRLRMPFERLAREAAERGLPAEAIVLMLQKWSETMPPRRGRLANIRDFMQLALEFDQPLRPQRKRRRRTPKRN